MAGLGPALYFPYIDLEARPLWGLLLWFEKLVILQPSFFCPAPCTEEAQRLGWLLVKRPVSLNLDNKHVRALLAEWERLGQLYQETGYLSYLKHGGLHGEEEPGWSLAKKIRDYGSGGEVRSPEEESLKGQLLLHLAQDLERQRGEIQEELAGLEESQVRMLRNMGVEDQEALGRPAEPLAAVEEDDFLIPQRIRAWAEMLVALEQGEELPLLTTNHLVLDQLVETAMVRADAGAGASPVAIMQLGLPMFSPLDGREVARIRLGLEGLVPWETFCEGMGRLMAELREASGQEIQAALPRARALVSYFHGEVREPLLERIVAMEPRWTEGWQEASLQVVLLPQWDARALGGDFSCPGMGNLVIIQLGMSGNQGEGSY